MFRKSGDKRQILQACHAEEVVIDVVEPVDGDEAVEADRIYEATSPSYPSTSEPESESILPQLGLVVGAVIALGAVLFFVRKKLFQGSKMEETIQGVKSLLRPTPDGVLLGLCQ